MAWHGAYAILQAKKRENVSLRAAGNGVPLPHLLALHVRRHGQALVAEGVACRRNEHVPAWTRARASITLAPGIQAHGAIEVVGACAERRRTHGHAVAAGQEQGREGRTSEIQRCERKHVSGVCLASHVSARNVRRRWSPTHLYVNSARIAPARHSANAHVRVVLAGFMRVGQRQVVQQEAALAQPCDKL